MPESVVQEVLQLDRLQVSEPEVVSALLKWGQAQVEADGHDPTDSAKLQEKIKPSLKSVRFALFDDKQFLELCRGDFGQALSWKDKFQILGCIVEKKWDTIPEHLCPGNFKPRINKQDFSVKILPTLVGHSNLVNDEKGKILSSFCLEVNRRCRLVGLKIILEEHTSNWVDAKPKMKPKEMFIYESYYKNKFSLVDTHEFVVEDGEDVVKLYYYGTYLWPDVEYKVTFSFPTHRFDPKVLYETYDYGRDTFSDNSKWLTVKAYGRLVGVGVKELLFQVN